jgi:predicted Zn-dependent peptidase
MILKNCFLKAIPFGKNILGTTESVGKMNGDDIRAFIRANYSTSEMIFAVHGNYDFKKIIKLSDKYFGGIAASHPQKNRIAPQANQKRHFSC